MATPRPTVKGQQAAGSRTAQKRQPEARRERNSELGERVWLVRAQRTAVFGALALVVVAALAVPTRSYLSQRSEIAAFDSELNDLVSRNDQLEARRDRLDDPEEIQQIARRDYGLVFEHEESYIILPSPTAGLVLPRSWPFDVLSDPLQKVVSGGS